MEKIDFCALLDTLCRRYEGVGPSRYSSVEEVDGRGALMCCWSQCVIPFKGLEVVGTARARNQIYSEVRRGGVVLLFLTTPLSFSITISTLLALRLFF